MAGPQLWTSWSAYPHIVSDLELINDAIGDLYDLTNYVMVPDADPTGATDSTTAVLAHAAAIGSTSGQPLVALGAGTFKLNLTALDQIHLRGLHSSLTTIIPASATSPIIDAGGTGGLADQASSIDHVRITTGGVDRSYAYPLLRFTLTRNLLIGDDVWFDVAGYTALCLQLTGVYQVRMRARFRTGKWAVPVEWDNTVGLPGSVIATGTVDTTSGSRTATATVSTGALAITDQIVAAGVPDRTLMQSVTGSGPYTVTLARAATATASGVTFETRRTPQCDTSQFDAQVDGTVGMIFRDAVNEGHGLSFSGKTVQTTYYATAPAENTTNPGATTAGATSFVVASGTGIIAGDVLILDPGWDVCEAVRVGSVAGTTITLHASTPLRFDHLASVEVFRGGIGFSFGNGYNNLRFNHWHFEGQQLGAAFGSCHNVTFEQPYKGVGRLVHVVGNLTNLQVNQPEMMGTVNLNELVRRSSNATGSSDGQWICLEPHVPAGVTAPTVPGAYFPHNTRNWMLRATQSTQIAEYWNAPTAQGGAYNRRVYINGTEKANLTYGGGGAILGRVATAVSYTLLTTDGEYIGVTDTSAIRTITLPAANAVAPGKTYTVKDESGAAGTNNITVARAGSDTIEGATTKTIATNYGVVRLYSDGVNKWLAT